MKKTSISGKIDSGIWKEFVRYAKFNKMGIWAALEQAILDFTEKLKREVV